MARQTIDGALHSAVKAAFESLHVDGWSLCETATADGWIITGRRGEDEIHVGGRTLSEAWAAAVAQADAMPTAIVEG
jgi:hypothetical protein